MPRSPTGSSWNRPDVQVVLALLIIINLGGLEMQECSNGSESSVECCAAADTRNWYERLLSRLFPIDRCPTPTVTGFVPQDVIHGRTIFKVCWLDRLRLLLTGVAIFEWRTATENPPGELATQSMLSIGTSRHLRGVDFTVPDELDEDEDEEIDTEVDDAISVIPPPDMIVGQEVHFGVKSDLSHAELQTSILLRIRKVWPLATVDVSPGSTFIYRSADIESACMESPEYMPAGMMELVLYMTQLTLVVSDVADPDVVQICQTIGDIPGLSRHN